MVKPERQKCPHTAGLFAQNPALNETLPNEVKDFLTQSWRKI